jgi:hypothetical protein
MAIRKDGSAAPFSPPKTDGLPITQPESDSSSPLTAAQLRQPTIANSTAGKKHRSQDRVRQGIVIPEAASHWGMPLRRAAADIEAILMTF